MQFVRIDPFSVDRGSRYTATTFAMNKEADFGSGMIELLRPKRFRTADRHIVAYRLADESGQLTEYKNDGYRSPSKETGAGMILLEIMRQRQVINRCLVVTRWYGGIHLGAERFKHIREAANAVLDRI